MNFTNYQIACNTGNPKAWQGMAANGQFVNAIREVRLQYAFGLKDAKDVVETYRDSIRKVNESSITMGDTQYTFIQNVDHTVTIEERTVKRYTANSIAEVVEFMGSRGYNIARA